MSPCFLVHFDSFVYNLFNVLYFLPKVILVLPSVGGIVVTAARFSYWLQQYSLVDVLRRHMPPVVKRELIVVISQVCMCDLFAMWTGSGMRLLSSFCTGCWRFATRRPHDYDCSVFEVLYQITWKVQWKKSVA